MGRRTGSRRRRRTRPGPCSAPPGHREERRRSRRRRPRRSASSANDAAWSAATLSAMSILNFAASSRSVFSLVVPAVTATFLPARSRNERDRRALLHQQLGARDEDRRRERDQLLALDVVRGRSAFEVDLARGDGGDARLRGHRLPLDRDRPANLLADRVDEQLAQVDRIADRLAARRQVRERNRRLAVADRDRSTGADLGERAGQLRRIALRCDRGRAGNEQQRGKRRQPAADEVA